MRSIFCFKNQLLRKNALVLLAVILVSCAHSTSPSSNRSSTSVSSSSTVTSVPSSSTITNVVKSASEAGVFIRSEEGFQCPLRAPYSGWQRDFSQRLVLATNRLIYSQSEIQQMKAYLNEIYSDSTTIQTSYEKQPPPTLRWVPGGSVCAIHLQITNISGGELQINLAGVQVIGKPRSNNYVYRALNICSIYSTAGLCGASGPGECSDFGVDINLNSSMANPAMVKPMNLIPNAELLCSHLYLLPKDVVDFVMLVTSSKPYIYAVVPVLSVKNSKGASIIRLSSMASTLTFATQGQISCYELNGLEFVLQQTFGEDCPI